MKSLSHVQFFASPWTVACQAPSSMEFSWQRSWNGLAFPSLGDSPNSGIKPGSPTLQADSLPSELPGEPSLCFMTIHLTVLYCSTTIYSPYSCFLDEIFPARASISSAVLVPFHFSSFFHCFNPWLSLFLLPLIY